MINVLRNIDRLCLFLMVVLTLGIPVLGQVPLQAQLQVEQSESTVGVRAQFTVIVTNISAAPIRVARFYLDPKRGDLSLMISSDGSNYRVYSGPEWETEEMSAPQIVLRPGEKVTGPAFPVFVNRSDQSKPTDLAQDFAFPAPGSYFVKATVVTSLGPLTSNVVQVNIRESHGDDAAVWEVIKHDKKLAQFIQRPHIENPHFEPVEATKLRELLNTYPNSAQATSIKRALDEHARNKALIKERMDANQTSHPRP